MDSLINFFYSKDKKKKTYSKVNVVQTKSLILKWDLSMIKIDLQTCMNQIEDFLNIQLEKWEPTEIFLQQIEDRREIKEKIIIKAFVNMNKKCSLQLHTKVCFKGVIPEHISIRSTSFDKWISQCPQEEKDLKIKTNYDLLYKN